MKQRALALAVKRIIWAELALSAAVAGPVFAQSQPAAATSTESPAAPAAAASGAAAGATTAAPAADSTTSTSSVSGKVQQLKTFEVTGSLIRQADKTGFQQVQVISPKQIQDSGAQSVSDYVRSISANSANSWG